MNIEQFKLQFKLLISNADKSDSNYFYVSSIRNITVSGKSVEANSRMPQMWAIKERNWKLWPKAKKVGKYPLSIDIESSAKCNLRCKMCSIDFGKINGGFMDMDLYKYIVSQFKYTMPVSVKFNWRGEPLMNKNLPEMIARAHDAGVVETQINTNGLLLDDDMRRELIDAGLSRIKISIDSIDKDKYKKIRGADFDVVKNNILSLMLGISNNKFPIVQVQMVYDNESVDELFDYYKYWNNIVDYIGFSRMHGTNKYKREDCKSVPCPQPFQRLLVTYDGNIVPCCMDRDLKMSLGNARDVRIIDAWNHPRLSFYRKMHATGNSDELSTCKVCDINKICTKGDDLFK